MGTTVQSAPEAAGVVCPKETGDLGPDKTCNDCQYQGRCYAAVLSALGV